MEKEYIDRITGQIEATQAEGNFIPHLAKTLAKLATHRIKWRGVVRVSDRSDRNVERKKSD